MTRILDTLNGLTMTSCQVDCVNSSLFEYGDAMLCLMSLDLGYEPVI